MAKVVKLNEQELKRLLRRLVAEQMVDVTDDSANPHKADHADPTGRNWDVGLDELDEEFDDELE